MTDECIARLYLDCFIGRIRPCEIDAHTEMIQVARARGWRIDNYMDLFRYLHQQVRGRQLALSAHQ